MARPALPPSQLCPPTPTGKRAAQQWQAGLSEQLGVGGTPLPPHTRGYIPSLPTHAAHSTQAPLARTQAAGTTKTLPLPAATRAVLKNEWGAGARGPPPAQASAGPGHASPTARPPPFLFPIKFRFLVKRCLTSAVTAGCGRKTSAGAVVQHKPRHCTSTALGGEAVAKGTGKSVFQGHF